MTTINLSDLCPITHGESTLSVDSERIRKGPLKGQHRGFVLVENRKANLSYKVHVDYSDGSARTCDADATADAIALMKDMIATNNIGPRS